LALQIPFFALSPTHIQPTNPSSLAHIPGSAGRPMNVFKLQRKYPQFKQEDILALSNNFA